MVVGRMNFFFAVKTFFYEKFGQKSGCVLYMGAYYTRVNTVNYLAKTKKKFINA